MNMNNELLHQSISMLIKELARNSFNDENSRFWLVAFCETIASEKQMVDLIDYCLIDILISVLALSFNDFSKKTTGDLVLVSAKIFISSSLVGMQSAQQ